MSEKINGVSCCSLIFVLIIAVMWSIINGCTSIISGDNRDDDIRNHALTNIPTVYEIYAKVHIMEQESLSTKEKFARVLGYGYEDNTEYKKLNNNYESIREDRIRIEHAMEEVYVAYHKDIISNEKETCPAAKIKAVNLATLIINKYAQRKGTK